MCKSRIRTLLATLLLIATVASQQKLIPPIQTKASVQQQTEGLVPVNIHGITVYVSPKDASIVEEAKSLYNITSAQNDTDLGNEVIPETDTENPENEGKRPEEKYTTQTYSQPAQNQFSFQQPAAEPYEGAKPSYPPPPPLQSTRRPFRREPRKVKTYSNYIVNFNELFYKFEDRNCNDKCKIDMFSLFRQLEQGIRIPDEFRSVFVTRNSNGTWPAEWSPYRDSYMPQPYIEAVPVKEEQKSTETKKDDDQPTSGDHSATTTTSNAQEPYLEEIQIEQPKVEEKVSSEPKKEENIQTEPKIVDSRERDQEMQKSVQRNSQPEKEAAPTQKVTEDKQNQQKIEDLKAKTEKSRKAIEKFNKMSKEARQKMLTRMFPQAFVANERKTNFQEANPKEEKVAEQQPSQSYFPKAETTGQVVKRTGLLTGRKSVSMDDDSESLSMVRREIEKPNHTYDKPESWNEVETPKGRRLLAISDYKHDQKDINLAVNSGFVIDFPALQNMLANGNFDSEAKAEAVFEAIQYRDYDSLSKPETPSFVRKTGRPIQERNTLDNHAVNDEIRQRSESDYALESNSLNSQKQYQTIIPMSQFKPSKTQQNSCLEYQLFYSGFQQIPAQISLKYIPKTPDSALFSPKLRTKTRNGHSVLLLCAPSASTYGNSGYILATVTFK